MKTEMNEIRVAGKRGNKGLVINRLVAEQFGKARRTGIRKKEQYARSNGGLRRQHFIRVYIATSLINSQGFMIFELANNNYEPELVGSDYRKI